MKLEFTAGELDAGRKLYNVLRNDMVISATLLKHMKNSGAIAVNGQAEYVSYILQCGDIVTADTGMCESETDIPPEHGEIEVLFENEALIAVNKPSGMLTHPSRSKYTGTLQNYVLGYITEHSAGKTCHAVNRLDRDTSGVVLFAKDAHFKRLAADALRDGSAGKEYLALICGELENRCGVIDLPIKRERDGAMLRVVAPDGKRAVTEYETVKSGIAGGGRVSLLRLRLQTGRTHQIRVHCAHLGVPILGDALYGTAESEALSHTLGITEQALHAERLRFKEPLSGKMTDIFAPLRRRELLRLLTDIGAEEKL